MPAILLIVAWLNLMSAPSAFGAGGDLDTAGFRNPTGSLLTDLGKGEEDHGYAVAVQEDGKILVVGESGPDGGFPDFALARYNPDGSLDTEGFGKPDGYVLTDLGDLSADVANAVAIQPDGKILVAGWSDVGGGIDFAVARYNPDGSLDTSGFNSPDGYATTDLGGMDQGFAVALQDDGKIVVAGSTLQGQYAFAAARYNADGSLDTAGFGAPDGYVVTSLPGSTYGTSVAIQEDGKIVVGGYNWSVNCDFVVARYDSAGALDTAGFGSPNGYALADLGGTDYGYGLAIQDDGKIVLAGTRWAADTSDFAAARWNADGSLDTEHFGSPTGFVTAGGTSEDWGFAVKVQGDGKIVVAGYSETATDANFSAVRFEPDGSLDTEGFGGSGGMADAEIGGEDYGRAMALLPDGRIVVAGSSQVLGEFEFALARFQADGTPDIGPDGLGSQNGYVLTHLKDYDLDAAYASVVQPDGKIVVAGSSDSLDPWHDVIVARYNPDGSLDKAAFGSPLGYVLTDLGGAERGAGVLLEPDGQIVVAGYRSLPGGMDFVVIRYHPDGTLDADGFASPNGYVITDLGGRDEATGVALQGNGKIVASGYTNAGGGNDFAVVRYNADGSLDTAGFGTPNGFVLSDLGGSERAHAMAIQPGGKIVVAGTSETAGQYDLAVARYNPNGSLDTAGFGSPNGYVLTDLGGWEEGYALAIQPDRKLVVAGSSNASGTGDFALVRYRPNGSLDTAGFGSPNGYVLTDLRGGDTGYAVAMQGSGRIVAGGMSSNGSACDLALAQYRSDGSLDTAVFGSPAGYVFTDVSLYDWVYDLSIQPNGMIVIAGVSETPRGDDLLVARYESGLPAGPPVASSGALSAVLGLLLQQRALEGL